MKIPSAYSLGRKSVVIELEVCIGLAHAPGSKKRWKNDNSNIVAAATVYFL